MRGREIRCIEGEKKMELFEEIAQLVKEELGISDTVKATTNAILSAILKDKKTKPLFKNKRSGVVKDFDLFRKKDRHTLRHLFRKG